MSRVPERHLCIISKKTSPFYPRDCGEDPLQQRQEQRWRYHLEISRFTLNLDIFTKLATRVFLTVVLFVLLLVCLLTDGKVLCLQASAALESKNELKRARRPAPLPMSHASKPSSQRFLVLLQKDRCLKYDLRRNVGGCRCLDCHSSFSYALGRSLVQVCPL